MWSGLNLRTYDIDDVHETAHGLDVDVAEVVVRQGHLGDVMSTLMGWITASGPALTSTSDLIQ